MEFAQFWGPKEKTQRPEIRHLDDFHFSPQPSTLLVPESVCLETSSVNQKMSPTLILLSHRAHKVITITFLTLWILAATGFAVLDFVDGWGYTHQFLSLSLLAYLICRLIVVFQKPGRDSSWAHMIVTARSRSRRRALATLVFSCGWIYEFVCKIFVLALMTLMSSAMIALHLMQDLEIAIHDNETKDGDSAELTTDMEKAKIDLEEAMAKIAEFHEEAGYDPVKLFGWMPPKLIIFCVITAWISVGTLAFYIARLAWKSLKRACMLPTPTVANPPEKQYGA
ncbi:hypothetical protein N7478_008200 [Penicillium angulare]|uniref:uncharacterized protein n=1 Tax=Penicillium angulare TaxID=116970 RepID=UPI0025417751|nr:uncharacterized protein N7478_008200 [Penicillium angulare]KAJ5273075.1 hypothetical protein N7478_008200 [Penicillium angulare]